MVGRVISRSGDEAASENFHLEGSSKGCPVDPDLYPWNCLTPRERWSGSAIEKFDGVTAYRRDKAGRESGLGTSSETCSHSRLFMKGPAVR